MKKIYLFAVGMLCMMCSCSSDQSLPMESKSAEVSVKVPGFNQTMNMFGRASVIGYDLTNVMSRSLIDPVDMNNKIVQSEEELAEIFRPMVESGRALIKEVVANADELGVTEADLAVLRDVSDANVALMMMTMTTYSYESETVTVEGREISMERIRDCLFQAVGISDIINILNGLAKNNVKKLLKYLFQKQVLCVLYPN